MPAVADNALANQNAVADQAARRARLAQHRKALGLTQHTLCHQRSLRISPEFGDRDNEAATFTHLGDTCHAADELPRPRDAWQKAFTILDDQRHPDADEVRVKLASIDRQMS